MADGQDWHDSAVHDVVAAIDAGELDRRKAWLDFSAEDEARLIALAPFVESFGDELIERLYDKFLGTAETAAFFSSEEEIERVKGLQREYFRRLLQGNYDLAYAAERTKIGSIHHRIGLDVKWYLGAYSFYIRSLTGKVFESGQIDSERYEAWQSLKKLMFLDIGLALDTYVAARERLIERQARELRELTERQQQETIRELSTPVLQIRQGLLILPIVGGIDSLRAQQITQSVLAAIRDRRGRVVVIDITGVPAVDSAVANHLVQTVEACRLMGAAVILTGLSPEVAQTLVTLGIDLAGMTTKGDLESGLEAAEEILGVRGGDSPARGDG